MSDMAAPAAVDPYEAVLADLRAKRDDIDRVINTLEAFRSGAPIGTPAQRPAVASEHPATGPGAFLGMTIVDGAKAYLARQRRPLGNADIVSALRAGGMVLNSADPINTVSSVLTRRFNQVGDVVRIGRGTWGLAEWYPNRSFKKKATVKDDDGTPSIGEAAQMPDVTLDDL